MWTLAAAIAFASLVGSFHCVGMCGPFALWATHGGNAGRTRSVYHVLSAYHAGRLTTYLSAGLAAGVLGAALTIGGQFAGYQSLAAKVAGGLLVIVGVVQLIRLTTWGRNLSPASGKSRIADLIQQAKPLLASRGPSARAYLTGLLTTWLPCGWLYLFVLVAGGTGDVFQAMAVMFAFWLGTLPALSVLAMGARTVAARFHRFVPLAAAVLLIGTGLYTATGRASADLSAMTSPIHLTEYNADSILGLTDEPLPCCEPGTESSLAETPD